MPKSGKHPCIRDLKMNPAREKFNRGQISIEDFKQAILQADKVCSQCSDPVCHLKEVKGKLHAL